MRLLLGPPARDEHREERGQLLGIRLLAGLGRLLVITSAVQPSIGLPHRRRAWDMVAHEGARPWPRPAASVRTVGTMRQTVRQ